ncbi:MAG: carbohydrate-binding domain-containing protein [Oscillospiraceae bacterium]|nr:carbohydrate-binding domain-containing protein [Oscillospiraceae bacterium]
MLKKLFSNTAALVLVCTAILAMCLAACGYTGDQREVSYSVSENSSSSYSGSQSGSPHSTQSGNSSITGNSGSVQEDIVTETDSDLFTERDLTQTADLSETQTVTVTSDSTYTIDKDGVYVLSGTAENFTVVVEAGDEDKVQLVLDGLSVTNENDPVIYVKNADKVFVTSAGDDSTLTVTEAFSSDGSTSTDAVIFSKDDLVLNGTGTVTISSADNGVSCKDDLKVTGGTWNITCAADALEANDSIAVAGGTLNIKTSKDGLHAEYNEDNTVGWITIEGGVLNITAGDDAIHATTILTVSGGELNITAAEGLEATQIEINGGTVDITATDDGINAGQKSKALSVGITVNGGEISIDMGAGDTDAVDSNGYLTITGGTFDISAQSAFDADGTISWTGGTIYVNGSQISTITSQMMGGGMMGGMPGGGMQGGMPGGNKH